MASAITFMNLHIGRSYMLSQHSIFCKLPVQRKLHQGLLKHCICLNEGCGTHCTLFHFVKTQLSVPALETIQLINNLMEVSCLLLSPLTWSLPPLFPKGTLASPPSPHSHRPSFLSPLKGRQVLPQGGEQDMAEPLPVSQSIELSREGLKVWASAASEHFHSSLATWGIQ